MTILNLTAAVTAETIIKENLGFSLSKHMLEDLPHPITISLDCLKMHYVGTDFQTVEKPRFFISGVHKCYENLEARRVP